MQPKSGLTLIIFVNRIRWVQSYLGEQTMSIHLTTTAAVLLAGALALSSPSVANDASEIKLPGDNAYPESIAAAPDGTLFVSSPAVGGVWRIKPQTAAVEEWIKPGAFGSRSTLDVLVDKKANLLWVCSNDLSSAGVPGPGTVPKVSILRPRGKVSAALRG